MFANIVFQVTFLFFFFKKKFELIVICLVFASETSRVWVMMQNMPGDLYFVFGYWSSFPCHYWANPGIFQHTHHSLPLWHSNLCSPFGLCSCIVAHLIWSLSMHRNTFCLVSDSVLFIFYCVLDVLFIYMHSINWLSHIYNLQCKNYTLLCGVEKLFSVIMF